MTIDAWLHAAVADAGRRGLPDLKPLLETLGRAASQLREADFNDDATGAGARAGDSRSAVTSPGTSTTAD